MTFIGKIYKIKSSKTDNVYIGSTIQTLNERFVKHKSDYKRFQNGKGGNITSFEIIKYPDAIIELIEEMTFETKDDMLFRERYHIENNNNCVNTQKPRITKEEDVKRNRENYQKTKEQAKERKQTKRIENQNKLCAQRDKYTHNITFNMNIRCEKVDIMK